MAADDPELLQVEETAGILFLCEASERQDGKRYVSSVAYGFPRFLMFSLGFA